MNFFRNEPSVEFVYLCGKTRVANRENRNLVRPAAGNTVTGSAWKTRTGSGRRASGIAERAGATAIRPYFISGTGNDIAIQRAVHANGNSIRSDAAGGGGRKGGVRVACI